MISYSNPRPLIYPPRCHCTCNLIQLEFLANARCVADSPVTDTFVSISSIIECCRPNVDCRRRWIGKGTDLCSLSLVRALFSGEKGAPKRGGVQWRNVPEEALRNVTRHRETGKGGKKFSVTPEDVVAKFCPRCSRSFVRRQILRVLQNAYYTPLHLELNAYPSEPKPHQGDGFGKITPRTHHTGVQRAEYLKKSA